LKQCPLAVSKCHACGAAILNKDLKTHVESDAFNHFLTLTKEIDDLKTILSLKQSQLPKSITKGQTMSNYAEK